MNFRECRNLSCLSSPSFFNFLLMEKCCAVLPGEHYIIETWSDYTCVCKVERLRSLTAYETRPEPGRPSSTWWSLCTQSECCICRSKGLRLNHEARGVNIIILGFISFQRLLTFLSWQQLTGHSHVYVNLSLAEPHLLFICIKTIKNKNTLWILKQ